MSRENAELADTWNQLYVFQSAPGSMSRENVLAAGQHHDAAEEVSIRSRLDEPGEPFGRQLFEALDGMFQSAPGSMSRENRDGVPFSASFGRFQSAPGSMSRENIEELARAVKRRRFNPLPAR